MQTQSTRQGLAQSRLPKFTADEIQNNKGKQRVYFKYWTNTVVNVLYLALDALLLKQMCEYEGKCHQSTTYFTHLISRKTYDI